MSASRNLAEFSTLSRQSRTRSGSSHDSLAMESIPMIAFMAVRMSWDMRERKSDLARLARSAISRALRSSSERSSSFFWSTLCSVISVMSM